MVRGKVGEAGRPEDKGLNVLLRSVGLKQKAVGSLGKVLSKTRGPSPAFQKLPSGLEEGGWRQGDPGGSPESH